jgi:hypothetical protein
MAEPEPGRSDLADLRNERTFPSFADCPEREISLDFYHVIDDKFLQPKYHWCLLAEITQVEKSFGPDILILKDRAGVELPMLLSIRRKYYDVRTRLEDGGYKRLHFRVGRCIAILYPIRHDFLSGDVGLRLAVESWAKVSSDNTKLGHADISGDSMFAGEVART